VNTSSTPSTAKRGHPDDRKACADMARALRKCVPLDSTRREWYHKVAESVDRAMTQLIDVRAMHGSL
jgi:hypothetical protein